MLSKNSASSRAIPFKKMVKMVEENPFIPLRFQKDHSGMQGTEYFEGADADFLAMDWKTAALKAVMSAEKLHGHGVTKQLCNRMLEAYAWHTVLITGTEWENFFALRANPAAEIHMAHLAELMLEAYNNAQVTQLHAGQWHMPYSDRIDYSDNLFASIGTVEQQQKQFLQICTARCAQTSYTLLGDDEKPMDYPKLITLHDRLLLMKHLSPFEHCARAMSDKEYHAYTKSFLAPEHDRPAAFATVTEYGWCKNYRGFVQYRALIPGENQEDSRVRKD